MLKQTLHRTMQFQLWSYIEEHKRNIVIFYTVMMKKVAQRARKIKKDWAKKQFFFREIAFLAV